MPDIEERLRSVQTRLSQATSQRTRDEVEVENATRALNEARETLKAEFEVVTSADLRETRERLEQELEASVTDAEAKLSAAGA